MPRFNVVIAWCTASFTAPMTCATLVFAPVAIAEDCLEAFVLWLNVGPILAAVGARFLSLLGKFARAANLVTGADMGAGAT